MVNLAPYLKVITLRILISIYEQIGTNMHFLGGKIRYKVVP